MTRAVRFAARDDPRRLLQRVRILALCRLAFVGYIVFSAVGLSAGMFSVIEVAKLGVIVTALMGAALMVPSRLLRNGPAQLMVAALVFASVAVCVPNAVVFTVTGNLALALFIMGITGLLIAGWAKHLDQSNTVRAWTEAGIIAITIIAWAVGAIGHAWSMASVSDYSMTQVTLVGLVSFCWLTPTALILVRVRWSPGPVAYILGVFVAGVALLLWALSGTMGTSDPSFGQVILVLVGLGLMMLGQLHPTISTLFDGTADWRSDRSWQRAALHTGFTAVAIGSTAFWQPAWYLAIPQVLFLATILLLASQTRLMSDGLYARRHQIEVVVTRTPLTTNQLDEWMRNLRPGGDSVALFGAIAVIPALDFGEHHARTTGSSDNLYIQVAHRMMDVASQFDALNEAKTSRWEVSRDSDRLFFTTVRPADAEDELGSFEIALGELCKAFDHRLEESFVVDGVAVRTDFTIGYSSRLVTADVDPATLQQDAAWAARIAAPGIPSMFTPSKRVEILHRAELAALFHQSLADGRAHPGEASDLSLVFEPVIDLHTGRTVGAEALTRWAPRGRRAVSPAEFIPIAERTRGLPLLGDWVLRAACLAIVRDGGSKQVTVNLSGAEVIDPDLAGRLLRTLEDFGVQPSSLVLEIAETVVDEAVAQGSDSLRLLAAEGVQLYMDDFGSAASGLSRIRSLPWSAIKLDRSIVRGLANPDGPEAPMIRAISGLAGELGIATLAEGVECVRTLRLAAELGCDLAQGWVYGQGRPSLGAAWSHHIPADWTAAALDTDSLAVVFARP